MNITTLNPRIDLLRELSLDESQKVVGGAATIVAGGQTGPNQYSYVVNSGGYIFECSVFLHDFGNVVRCEGAGIEYISVGEPKTF
jgi:hypothetical protein